MSVYYAKKYNQVLCLKMKNILSALYFVITQACRNSLGKSDQTILFICFCIFMSKCIIFQEIYVEHQNYMCIIVTTILHQVVQLS
jgi:hypothetical protein